MNERNQKAAWSDWLALGLVAATAPAFLFPRAEWTWVFFLAPAAWLLRLRGQAGRGVIERTPLDWGIGLLAVQIFVTCLIAPDIAFGRPKIAGALFGMILFYSAIAVLASERAVKTGTVLFLIAGSILAVFGVVGMIFSPEKPFMKMLPGFAVGIPVHNWKLPGAEPGFNPNAVGGALCFVIPPVLILFFSKMAHASIKKAVLAAMAISMLSALFISQSIGSWIAIFLAVGIVVLIGKRAIWILPATIMLLAGIWMIRPARGMLQEKVEQRYKYWSTGIRAIEKHPFSGVGMNRLRLDPGIGYDGASAHNHLIHTAAELGIPGLIAYLTILIGAGRMCQEVWRKGKAGWMRDASRGLGAGQLAYFIFGMGDSIPLGAKAGVLFWASLALIAAMNNCVHSRSQE